VDLTEPRELPTYEGMLPFATADGRRISYLREPVPDHGVPPDRESMSRLLESIDAALAANHVVYVHCRAGIGRSATVAGCWLAARSQATDDPLVQLQSLWQQSARSLDWQVVPETAEQAKFVRTWPRRSETAPTVLPASRASATGTADRIRGALLGLALGDATGAARTSRGVGTAWTQHTALALCLAESLLEAGRFDARDQIERYLRWQHEGHLAADGRPGTATPDVARALATYQWRRLPMAGSHDPRDHSTASLPRVVSAVAFSAADPGAAVLLAAACSRCTHQSPVVLDACRYYGALLLGAFKGDAPQVVLADGYEPFNGLWSGRPLRPEIATTTLDPESSTRRSARSDVVEALGHLKASLSAADGVIPVIEAAVATAREPALAGAIAGALAGAFHGGGSIPPAELVGVARLDVLEAFAARLVNHPRAVVPQRSEVGW
jgi:ADP-ribosylglycohydrolase